VTIKVGHLSSKVLISTKKKRKRNEIRECLACQTEEAWTAPLGESHLEPKHKKSLRIDQNFSSASEV
jgi:hypothetical protein